MPVVPVVVVLLLREVHAHIVVEPAVPRPKTVRVEVPIHRCFGRGVCRRGDLAAKDATGQYMEVGIVGDVEQNVSSMNSRSLAEQPKREMAAACSVRNRWTRKRSLGADGVEVDFLPGRQPPLNLSQLRRVDRRLLLALATRRRRGAGVDRRACATIRFRAPLSESAFTPTSLRMS